MPSRVWRGGCGPLLVELAPVGAPLSAEDVFGEGLRVADEESEGLPLLVRGPAPQVGEEAEVEAHGSEPLEEEFSEEGLLERGHAHVRVLGITLPGAEESVARGAGVPSGVWSSCRGRSVAPGGYVIRLGSRGRE